MRFVWLGLMAGLLAISLLPQVKLPARADTASVNVWWPKAGVSIAGVQPFKAAVNGLDVGDYRMTWRVDGGNEIGMFDSYQDYPHKEAMVDVSGWSWKGIGPYIITYTAYDASGRIIDTQDVSFSLPGAATATPAPIAQAAVKQLVPAAKPIAALGIGALYVDGNSPAAQQAAAWQGGRPGDADALRKIAGSAGATWFGGWNADVRGNVDELLDRANGATPVMVAYNVPGRDCGSYSAGGAPASAYGGWISALAAGLGGRKAVIILEPDALAQVTCLSAADQNERYQLLANAVSIIKQADAQAKVYLDAGHAGWIGAADMASRLNRAGLVKADGFSLNVSNFVGTQESQAYGHLLSAATGGKHFVIDTSRNGLGAAQDNAWCNPDGRALGLRPTTATNDPLADAYLWIKTPGESDGNCNGGPGAGSWWADYALGLAKRASY